MMKAFGMLDARHELVLKGAMIHSDNLYSAVFDRPALWDPATIEKVLHSFPKGHIDEGELFLILAECIANSVLHGQAEAMGMHARQRGSVLLLSFHQIPPMTARVHDVLVKARNGDIPEVAVSTPGGLGFPILIRIAHKITLSNDFSKLQLWVAVKP